MGGGDGQDESAACSLFPVSLGLAYEQWLKGLAGHAGRRSSSARHRRRTWGTHGLFWGRALSGPPYKRGPWHFRLSIALVRLLSLFSPPSTGFLLVGGHTSLCNPPSHRPRSGRGVAGESLKTGLVAPPPYRARTPGEGCGDRPRPPSGAVRYRTWR